MGSSGNLNLAFPLQHCSKQFNPPIASFVTTLSYFRCHKRRHLSVPMSTCTPNQRTALHSAFYRSHCSLSVFLSFARLHVRHLILRTASYSASYRSHYDSMFGFLPQGVTPSKHTGRALGGCHTTATLSTEEMGAIPCRPGLWWRGRTR